MLNSLAGALQFTIDIRLFIVGRHCVIIIIRFGKFTFIIKICFFVSIRSECNKIMECGMLSLCSINVRCRLPYNVLNIIAACGSNSLVLNVYPFPNLNYCVRIHNNYNSTYIKLKDNLILNLTSIV